MCGQSAISAAKALLHAFISSEISGNFERFEVIANASYFGCDAPAGCTMAGRSSTTRSTRMIFLTRLRA